MIKKLFLISLCQTTLLGAQWVIVDSISNIFRVPAGNHVYSMVNPVTDSVTSIVSIPSQKLSSKAFTAISRSPQWLKIALEDKFSSLSEVLQDSYAQIIIGANDPFVDEIAFTIAHLPNEVITNKSFYSDIIKENALNIYRADSSLDYVSIVDSGTVAQGGDYYSTTSYRVLENGKETQYVLPKEIYYWFVVHPKLQGEMPAYISSSSPNPTSPSQGKFWRSYLWDHREKGYGALCDTMKGITFLWANKVNSVSENGALGRLSQWCNLIMPWGGGYPQYRWPQPVYLYHQHCGTCSEHGWFASAAARTVLIPVTLTKAPRYDHKWNEFFYKRWIDWEPINGWIDRMDEPSHANDYWADPTKTPLNGCFNWRGDGFIWGTTEHYSQVCTLTVVVTDSRGKPVDGARITIDADGVPGNFLMAGWTGSNGTCRFLLGDEVSAFTGAVQSIRGNVAKTVIIRNSVAGKSYEWNPRLSGSAKVLQMQITGSHNTESNADSRIAFSIDAQEEIIYGKHEYSLYDYSFPCTFSDVRQSGSVDFFICNQENYDKYLQGKIFETAVLKKDITSIDSFFTVPDGKQSWYVVVAGDEKSTVTSVAKLNIRLLRMNGSAVNSSPALLSRFLLYNENDFVHIHYISPGSQKIFLQIFDILGKPVLSLFEGLVPAGMMDRSFPIKDLPGGIYVCKFRSNNLESSIRLIVH